MATAATCNELLLQLQQLETALSHKAGRLDAAAAQLGDARDALCTTVDCLAGPPVHGQHSCLGKLCQDLDEVLMGLAELQLNQDSKGSGSSAVPLHKVSRAIKSIQQAAAAAAAAATPPATTPCQPGKPASPAKNGANSMMKRLVEVRDRHMPQQQTVKRHRRQPTVICPCSFDAAGHQAIAAHDL